MSSSSKDVTNVSCTSRNECADCQQKTYDISCFKKIAGVLSEDEVKTHKLIVKPNDENFSPTVYDLSLGGFHYLYGIGKDTQVLTPICIDSDPEMQAENSKGGEQFVRPYGNATNILTIPRLGSALIQLNEIVDTYTIADKNNVLITGRFDLKLSLVNRGLVSQQGTQVEPCYKGRLYCFVHNFSNKAIELKYGDPIASVEFSYVSCFCNEDKRTEVILKLMERNKDERYLTGEYCDPGKGIMNVRYFRRKKTLPDECGLFSAISVAKDAAIKEVTSELMINDITTKVKQKIDRKGTIITSIITAFASISVALIMGYFTYVKPMNDANKEYKNKIDFYQQSISTYENSVNDLKARLNILEKNTIISSEDSSGQTNP